jgi:hypothetical protein
MKKHINALDRFSINKFLLKVACYLILFFLIPLIMLKSDNIDTWCDDIHNQVYIVVGLAVLLFFVGYNLLKR